MKSTFASKSMVETAIESGDKLTEEEEQLIAKYFANYEFAINVNKLLRGEAFDKEKVTQRKCEVMLAALKNKGLVLQQDVVLYRAMSQPFSGTTAEILQTARGVPVGLAQTCFISAASRDDCINFGGGKDKYAIAAAKGTRCFRRLTRSVGLGEWQEYLLPPGHIVFFGDYSVQQPFTPVVYPAYTVPDNQRMMQLVVQAGMSPNAFIRPVQREEPVKSEFVGQRMLFPWGYEETSVIDGTIRIFDVRRQTKWPVG